MARCGVRTVHVDVLVVVFEVDVAMARATHRRALAYLCRALARLSIYLAWRGVAWRGVAWREAARRGALCHSVECCGVA